jgi:hypothetical protein
MTEAGQAAAAREGVLRRISGILDAAEYRRVETRRYSAIHLEAPGGADYAFMVWVYDDGEPQISARLNGSVEDDHFWGKSFELPDYGSVEARTAAFLEVLERVVTCPTRITQEKGWLFWHFHCDARVGSTWVSVGGHSAARWSFGVRDTGRREAAYSSPALRGRRAVET